MINDHAPPFAEVNAKDLLTNTVRNRTQYLTTLATKGLCWAQEGFCVGSWALASNRIDFSQNRFEEVSLKIPQGFFKETCWKKSI